jgi:putative Holliday junction resolvase
MKYLGIDYGSKKVGYAQSDDDGRLAFPLMISKNDSSLLKDTLELIREMKFSTVVIGESVDAKGKPNDIAKEARKFGMQIENNIDVAVVFEKEWYSTMEARASQPGKAGDHEVDDQAAAIVLQRYLDKINGPGESSEEYVEADDDGDTGDSDY